MSCISSEADVGTLRLSVSFSNMTASNVVIMVSGAITHGASAGYTLRIPRECLAIYILCETIIPVVRIQRPIHPAPMA